MNIVNIVASGDIGEELDLHAIYNDLNIEDVQYEPEQFPGVQLRFSQEGPVVILFSSGSYTIVGVKTEEQVSELYKRLNNVLQELEVKYDFERGRPEIQNLICKGELSREIDLDNLVVALGLENIEYEPEQSPVVYYWPEEADCLITIPTNGQCIVTGVSTLEEAEEAFTNFQNQIERLFTNSMDK